jgi:hypothetical protein
MYMYFSMLSLVYIYIIFMNINELAFLLEGPENVTFHSNHMSARLSQWTDRHLFGPRTSTC